MVHFRPHRINKSNYTFKCGDKVLETVPQYIYLGLLFSEDLDYEKVAKHVCKAANRALGLVIAKSKALAVSTSEHFLDYTIPWYGVS